MDTIIIIICLILLVVYIVTITWICQEANIRKNASPYMAFIFSFGLSPIAGLLYLHLFPERNEESSMPKIITEDNRDFQEGDIVIEKSTGKEIIIKSILPNGKFICWRDKNKVFMDKYSKSEIETVEEYNSHNDQ